MRDVKWEYGDIVLDSAGRAELLSESDSEFQRALIRMSAKRGCFIYDRELGADCENIWTPRRVRLWLRITVCARR